MHSSLVSLAVLALCAGCGDVDQSPPSATPATPQTPQAEAGQAETGAWRIAPKGDLNGLFNCLAKADATIVSAHRGGPAPGYPENAIETFDATLRASPALVEMDVATSADGVLYLMHDDTLDRTTTGSGLASEATWAEISRLRLLDENNRRTDYSPPSFAEALRFLKPRTIAQIDFKRSTRYEDAIDEIKRQNAEDRVILIAYSLAGARKLHRLAPEMMISLSIDNEDELTQAMAGGAPANRLMGFTGTQAPSPRINAALDALGVETIFGALGGRRSIDNQIAASGDESRYADIAETGVDILATDRPIEAHRALAKAGLAPEAGECGVTRR